MRSHQGNKKGEKSLVLQEDKAVIGKFKFECLKPWSFRTKFLISTLLVSLLFPTIGVYLVLAGELNFSKRLIKENLEQQIEAYKAQLTPTLLFDDSQTAHEIIQTILYNPLIIKADLWKKNTQSGIVTFDLFASSGDSVNIEPFHFELKEEWDEESLAITKKVSSGNETLGYFSVNRSLSDLSTRTEQFINFGLLSWFVIFTVIVIVTIWYQNSLTLPMHELMNVAEKISSEKNYKLRAQQLTKDEFGRLTKIFNQMLDSLNYSNEKLVEANNQMENKVQTRTRELSESNEKLVKEMEIREKTHKELTAAREKLNLQEKLASVGQVSSNIAHELRNPMAAIRNAVYFLRTRMLEDPQTIEKLDIIDGELNQGDEVIERLLELTKGKKIKVVQTDLEKIAQEAFLVSNPPEKITLKIEVDSSVALIELDPILFRQILTNLFTNSIQAQATHNKGSILLKATKNGLDHAEIRIVDNGIGVPKQNWKKIFDPLFTDKADGIGLGLSLCQELVERHNGSIRIESSSAIGTCVLVKIPILSKKSLNLTSRSHDLS